MDLLSLKIIVLSISGAIRLFFGLIPLILMKSFTKRLSSKKIKYVISILMFFGGGVLLATCLLHMMPGVRESFASVNLKTELPVPELIFVGGFFLVYLLEDIVHGVIHRRRQNKEQKKLRIKSPTGTDMPQHISPKRSPNSSYKAEIPNDYGYGNPNKVSYTTNGFWPNEPQDIHHTPSIIPRARSGSDTGNGNHKQIVDPEWWRDTVVSTNNSQLSLITGSIPSINSTKPHAHSDESDDEHNHHIPFDESDPSVAGAIRNLLIVIAISFHAVFEGLAIGLQGTEKDVWALFIAVSLHECTIIFCIGVELISAKTKVLRMLTYILVVSLVSPLGIGIGILISEQSTGSTMLHVLLVGSLQGVAAGTLLYVTFFEIFAAEGRKIENKVIHIIVAILGFILMTSIDMMGGHSHGHGNENLKSTSINSTQVEHDHGHHSHSHGHSGEHESGELHEHDHDHSH